MDIEKYRKESENFLSELEREYYIHYSGKKNDLSTAEIYNRYASLFSYEKFSQLRNIAERSSGDELKRYLYLLKFCAEGLIENSVKEIADEIGKLEAKTNLIIDGRDVSFRYSEVLLSNEESNQKRDLIDDIRNKTVEENFNPRLRQYWKKLHGEAAKLGFDSYRDLFSFVMQQDFFKLEDQMDEFLEETRDLYEDNFSSLLSRELDIDLGSSRKSDFAFLKRAKKFDKFFKKESIVDIFRDTLLSMGIDIKKQKNIILDTEERKNKAPRAFCSTVNIPYEIYLVIMPIGGQDDYESLFHEGGHSEHFGVTDPGLEFEFRYLGDNAVTEGYAFLMEHLIKNKNWLIYFLGMSPGDAEEFINFSNILKLWFCRRYAGKLKYELVLHDPGPITGKNIIYRDILGYANLMKYSETDYLRDVDNGFYCINYIRAWIFEAQLKDYMQTKFGYSWFKEKKAGDFLRRIWFYGQKYDPVEILTQLGFKNLDIGYLIDSLKEGIKGNS